MAPAKEADLLLPGGSDGDADHPVRRSVATRPPARGSARGDVLRGALGGAPAHDLALAVVVTAVALVGYVAHRAGAPEPDSLPFTPPDAVGATELAVAAMSLAWRRVATLPVLVVCTADLSLRLAQDYPVTFLPYALLVAVFTAADGWSTRPAVVATVLAWTAPAVATLVLLDPGAEEDALLVLGTCLAGAFAAGVAWRHRRLGAHTAVHRAELLYDRARQLTREHQDAAGIARELHDVVASNLGLIVVSSRAAIGAPRDVADTAAAARGPDTRDDALATIEQLGRETLAEMRRIVGVQLADGDEHRPTPVLADLALLVTRVNSVGTVVDLRVTGRPRPLPPVVELMAYRIVQEALTNALRHGPGHQIDVEVVHGLDELGLTVVDRGRPRVDRGAGEAGGAGGAEGEDGAGAGRPPWPPLALEGPGHGLAGMRRRADLLGGRLDVAFVGTDFTVRAWLPVPREAAT